MGLQKFGSRLVLSGVKSKFTTEKARSALIMRLQKFLGNCLVPLDFCSLLLTVTHVPNRSSDAE